MWVITDNGAILNANMVECFYYNPKTDNTYAEIGDNSYALWEGDKTPEIYSWLRRNQRCFHPGV